MNPVPCSHLRAISGILASTKAQLMYSSGCCTGLEDCEGTFICVQGSFGHLQTLHQNSSFPHQMCGQFSNLQIWVQKITYFEITGVHLLSESK